MDYFLLRVTILLAESADWSFFIDLYYGVFIQHLIHHNKLSVVIMTWRQQYFGSIIGFLPNSITNLILIIIVIHGEGGIIYNDKTDLAKGGVG